MTDIMNLIFQAFDIGFMFHKVVAQDDTFTI